MSRRNALYKNDGKSVDNLRKSRVDFAVSLRKEQRDQLTNKRRNIHQNGEQDAQQMMPQLSMNVDEIVANAQSPDIALKLQAITQLHKLVSSDYSPLVDDLISRGILPILVSCLQTENESLQFEAVCSLTYITCGTTAQTYAVVEVGIVQQLMNLLSSTNMEMCEQVICVLGNIVSEGAVYRNYCIELGLIPVLLMFVQPDLPASFLENVVWVLVNVCCDKSCPPSQEVVNQILPELFKLVHYDDETVVKDAVWAVYYISKFDDDYTQKIIEIGFVPRLIQLLGEENVQLLIAATGTIGNIVAGTDEQAQFVLNCGALEKMLSLFERRKLKVIKNVVHFISNVVAGTPQQRQAIMDAGFVPPLLQWLDRGDFTLQKDIIFLVEFMTEHGSNEEVLFLVKNGVLVPLCNLLNACDVDGIQSILQSLLTILKKLPDNVSEIAQKIEELGALGKIEELEDHNNEEICQQAYNIIQEFYSGNDSQWSNNSAFERSQGENEPSKPFQF